MREGRGILLVFAKLQYGFLIVCRYICHGQFSLKKVFLRHPVDGTVSIPEKNRINSAGVNEISINTSLPKGSFSTPGYKDINYQGDFYKTSHLIHFQLNISSFLRETWSVVLEVDVAEGIEWMYSKQDKKLKLYMEKLNFSEAEQFCVNRGGHLAPMESEERSREILNAIHDFEDWVWLGGTNEKNER